MNNIKLLYIETCDQIDIGEEKYSEFIIYQDGDPRSNEPGNEPDLTC